MAASGFLMRDEFFVRERVGFMKLVDVYEILDAKTQQPVGFAREAPPSWAKWLRLLINKKLLPTDVVVTEGVAENGPLVFRIHRAPSLLRARVTVHDANAMMLGSFRSKLFSLGGGFWVHDAQGNQVAEVKGDWKGWDFKFLDGGGRELGVVTKKWAGLAKEFFTSADNYVVALRPDALSVPHARELLLAAALSIDLVFKEDK